MFYPRTIQQCFRIRLIATYETDTSDRNLSITSLEDDLWLGGFGHVVVRLGIGIAARTIQLDVYLACVLLHLLHFQCDL
jgi:hypothetical protein